MTVEGIDSMTGGRHRRNFRDNGGRDKAEDFPLFYRTRESMVIDEAIYASLRHDLDVDSDDGDTDIKGKELSDNEIETIQKVVGDVDGLVKKLMSERFQEPIFTCGVLNCFLIAYVFFVCPQNFWILYLAEMIVLVPLNQYHRIRALPLNKSLYYLDFCWVANLIAIGSLITIVLHSIIASVVNEDIAILSDNIRKHLFMAVLGTSCG